MNPDTNIPSFNDPLPIDLFLESSVNSYIYDDLRQFEHVFLRHLKETNYDFDKPLAVSAASSDELVFIIASCWRLGIPFIPIAPELPKEKQTLLLQQLDIDLFIGSQSKVSPHSSLKCIGIERFTLSKILSPDFSPEDWVEEHKKNINSERCFGYFFTSGTTGTPKIVPLKRRQMFYAAKASVKNLRTRRNHFWLLSLPLHHIGGISVILRSLLYGAGVYRTNGFDISKTTKLLKRDHRLEAASLVPTMLSRLMDRSDFSVHDNFQAILLGGGPVDPSLVDECFSRGIPVISSYGMTESCAQIAANPQMTVGDLSRPRKSAGKIFHPNRIEIRDKDGKPAETSGMGRIWLKGPQLFDGYLNRDNTHYFDERGWFNTGDYGYLNEQNELFIESRRTDLIVSGGENISPTEVEHSLKKLSGIRDAAVAGVPDKEWGQKVVALITTKKNRQVDSDHIREQLKPLLQSFKIPKQIIRVDDIPRTATGKIKRSKVKEIFSR